MLKTNVILLSPLPPPYGGIAMWAERYIACADLYGINIKVVNENKGTKAVFGKFSKLSLIKQIKRSFNIWKNLKQTLIENANERKIVHSNIPSTFLSLLREKRCLKISQKYNAKFVFHFHCTVSVSSKNIFTKGLLKKLLKKCDGVIVLNEKSFNFIKQINSKIPVRIIANFVKNSEINSAYKVRKKISQIVYVGGVTKEKGCLDVINIAKKMPDITFMFIGNLSNKIAKLNLHKYKNIIFTGEKSNDFVKKQLEKSDLFIFLSKFKFEGFSVALTEAISIGLPCICTDWAASKDQLGIYFEECMVDSKKTNNIILKIRSLSNNIELREKISLYNKNRVSKFYSESVILNQYKKFYEEILK